VVIELGLVACTLLASLGLRHPAPVAEAGAAAAPSGWPARDRARVALAGRSPLAGGPLAGGPLAGGEESKGDG
jgi:hypothetical protein